MHSSVFDIVVVSVGISLSFLLYRITVRAPKGLRFPPGPPRHPIWGNLKDLPSGVPEYKVFEKWAKEYGDMVYLNTFGQSMLVINSADVARDLFTKKGAIYSGRNETTMLHDLTNFGKTTLFTMDYSDRSTRLRAMLHELISYKSIHVYHSLMETMARSFAQRLITERVNDLRIVRNTVGRLIIQLTYGIEVLPENDPYVSLADRTMHNVTRVIVPGTYMVDILPILKYLPSWLPGLEFRKVVKEINKDFKDLTDLPYEYAKNALKQGNFRPCFVTNYLEDIANDPNAPQDAEEVIRQLAAVFYLAGMDTLETQIRVFFLAMALYPDVQKKAQEELDSVIARDSLPSFDDLPNLPYLNALRNEVLRWHPAGPMGLPHKLKEDDVINGCFIPKGTMCIGNIWFLLRSEKEYGSETHKFKPERFLDGSAKVQLETAFGFGRRVCPGRALAEDFLIIIIATVLHTANISELEGEPLACILENYEVKPGVTGRPRDFNCKIEARLNAKNILDQFI